jgi:hypothetical protein
MFSGWRKAFQPRNGGTIKVNAFFAFYKVRGIGSGICSFLAGGCLGLGCQRREGRLCLYTPKSLLGGELKALMHFYINSYLCETKRKNADLPAFLLQSGRSAE